MGLEENKITKSDYSSVVFSLFAKWVCLFFKFTSLSVIFSAYYMNSYYNEITL